MLNLRVYVESDSSTLRGVRYLSRSNVRFCEHDLILFHYAIYQLVSTRLFLVLFII